MYIRCWLYSLFIFVVSYFIGKFSIWKAYVVVSKLAMNLILLVLILNHRIFFFNLMHNVSEVKYFSIIICYL